MRCGARASGAPSTHAPSAVTSPDQRSDDVNGTSSRTVHRSPGSAAASAAGGEVRCRDAAGERPERGRDPAASGPSSGSTSVEREPAGGERAGLVGADDVDVADRLDGVDLLHQRAAPGDPGRSGGVGDRDEEEQAVGHEPGQHGGGLHDPQQAETLQRGLGQDGAAHQHGQRDHQPHHELDPPLQRGLVGRHPAGLRGEPSGVARRPDVAGQLVTLAGHAEAARAQLVAGSLGHRLGLAGEQ